MNGFNGNDGSTPGRPFAVHVRSGSPVMGCLVALGVIAIVALIAIGAGVFILLAPVALIVWSVVKAFLPGGKDEPNMEVHSTPGVIDVEATVLPPVLKDQRQHEDSES